MIQEGEPVPALDERPFLYPELMWLWKAFIRLDRGRQSGFNGPESIRVVDIEALASLMKISDVAQRLTFLDRMQKMDEIYMAERNKPKPKRAKK